MKLLAEITDKSLGLSDFEVLEETFKLRKSARAILVNDDGKIAIQYLANRLFHKLPGGGVENNETVEETLHRELKEEAGCDIEILRDIGIVIEYREGHRLLHISYCFLARVNGPFTETNLEQAEIDEGMSTIWISPEEAVTRMKNDIPNTYQGKFILQRELSFLEEYLKTFDTK